MELKPIVTRRVYQEIIQQFVEMVRQDKIKVGEKLPSERELAEMFQVSRPSVREAFRVLETIGLIDIHAGGGVYLTELNLGPFLNTFAPLITKHRGFELELLVLREIMEIKAVELCALTCDEDCARELGEAISGMETALVANDAEAGMESDVAFHTGIFEKSRKFLLMKAAEFVNSLLEISIKDGRRLVLEQEENAAQLLEDHRGIYTAIVANDVELARRRMADHISMVRRLYLETRSIPRT